MGEGALAGGGCVETAAITQDATTMTCAVIREAFLITGACFHMI